MKLVQPATTQGEIISRQFRKKRSAVWGLRVAIFLLLVAIYVPLVASSHPLYWSEPGWSGSPWLERLFDANAWEHAVDRFFNLLLVAVTVYGAARLVLRLAVRDGDRRSRAGRRLARWFAGATAVLAALQGLGLVLVTSSPIVDYRARAAELRSKGVEFTSIRTPIPYGYREQLPEIEQRFRPAFDFEGEHAHVLGTDEIGRDVFARILYGTRISLTIGVLAVAIYSLIGVVLGSSAGYFRGRIDLVIMRALEIVICIPALFLILIIVALFEQRSIFLIMLAIGLVGWTGVTRLVRGEFLRERTLDYVTAARSLGLSDRRIVFRHILPNALAPVLVSATFGVAGAILMESSVAFIGLGDVTVPSWGRILDDGRIHGYWHLIFPPAVAIFVTVTALSLVGDGLRDALDPKLRA